MYLKTIRDIAQTPLPPISGLVPTVGTAEFFPRLQVIIKDLTKHRAFLWSASEAGIQLWTEGPSQSKQCLQLLHETGTAQYALLHGDLPESLIVTGYRTSNLHDNRHRRKWMLAHGFNAELSITWMSQSKAITFTAHACEDDAFEAATVVSEFVSFASLALPLVQLHIRLTETGTSPVACAGGMEKRLAAMFPELTSRERQVCARSIIGMTAEGIALDLGIKQTSVLTYRRRAYARLNICSINQLSSMLIQSGNPIASAA